MVSTISSFELIYAAVIFSLFQIVLVSIILVFQYRFHYQSQKISNEIRKSSNSIRDTNDNFFKKLNGKKLKSELVEEINQFEALHYLDQLEKTISNIEKKKD
jgi:hypothetical protein